MHFGYIDRCQLTFKTVHGSDSGCLSNQSNFCTLIFYLCSNSRHCRLGYSISIQLSLLKVSHVGGPSLYHYTSFAWRVGCNLYALAFLNKIVGGDDVCKKLTTIPNYKLLTYIDEEKLQTLLYYLVVIHM